MRRNRQFVIGAEVDGRQSGTDFSVDRPGIKGTRRDSPISSAMVSYQLRGSRLPQPYPSSKFASWGTGKRISRIPSIRPASSITTGPDRGLSPLAVHTDSMNRSLGEIRPQTKRVVQRSRYRRTRRVPARRVPARRVRAQRTRQVYRPPPPSRPAPAPGWMEILVGPSRRWRENALRNLPFMNGQAMNKIGSNFKILGKSIQQLRLRGR